MVGSSACLGHQKREDRKNVITKLATTSKVALDEYLKVLIKKGPVCVETSLKELEDHFKNKPEWKVIENGGVLSVPVEELRMENPPQPDHSGRVVFKEKEGGNGKQIENYPVARTVDKMAEFLNDKYEEVKHKAKSLGASEAEAEKKSFADVTKLPQFQALKAWQDTLAEINLKKAVEKMMTTLKIPTLVIRSLNLKKISALNDLGLKLPVDAEIDLVMAYATNDTLHVNIFEVKRCDTFPWDNRPRCPNKQGIMKAENQLNKDLDIMTALLVDKPPRQIHFHTFACYPDSSIDELRNIFCSNCLETGVIFKEELNDLCLLQKKIQVPEKVGSAKPDAQRYLLSLSARCLSHQSSYYSIKWFGRCADLIL